MSGHNYHYHCGCSQCCKHEEALERAEADRERDTTDDEPEPDAGPRPTLHGRLCCVLGCLLAPALCLSWVHSVWWLVTWAMGAALLVLWESIGGPHGGVE